MLTIEEIKTFIDNDNASIKKQFAKIGQRYYEGDHDIHNARIFFINANGALQEDLMKSNVRISHPFFKLLADQEAQFILSSKDGLFKTDMPELQTELDAYFNDNESFMAELIETITGCIAKGYENMYAYKNDEGKTSFMCADSLGVVEVKAKETADHCDYIIYWYIDTIGKDNKVVKRIQVWDTQQTYYYCQIDGGEITLDDSIEMNPRPHIIYKEDNGTEGTYSADSYGVIPFFELPNGKKRVSGVKHIKNIIDDYDNMACGLSNNINDTNESLYIVRGFMGDNLDELMLNIKAKKMVGVSEEGGVDIQTIDIPVEARKTKMEIDEKDIFRFGMGVNTEALKDSSATVSIAIKTAYANLDLKCDGLKPFLIQFLRKLLDLVLNEINDEKGTDYEQKDVYFNLNRETIVNATENAQMALTEAQEQQTRATTIMNVASLLGNELTMQLLCDVLDIDYDDIKSQLPAQEVSDPYAASTALSALQNGGNPAAPNGGGDVA